MEPLIASTELTAREMLPHEVPLLQALFDANPAYFELINGRAAHADEAQLEFDETPPPPWRWTRRWVLGWFDPAGELVGVTIVVADLGAPSVWHLALFLLATRWHGTGVAQRAYNALEEWIRSQDAAWLRLAVVQANGRARRFWQRQGFADLRLREGFDTGGRLNDVRTCCKPLAGGTIAQYLALMPGDAPGQRAA